MPNDAKFGLVLGLGLVLLIGIVFFRQDPAVAGPDASAPAPVRVPPPAR